jgi:hypothetical protein
VYPLTFATTDAKKIKTGRPEVRCVFVAFVLTGLMGFGAEAAELDDWCAQVKKPSSIVICSDAGLRQLAIDRNKAFSEAHSRLSPEVYQQLLEDQKRWISSYSQACGIPEDKSVQNPVSPSIIECFRRAGQARVQYIRTYGGSSAGAPTQLVSPAPTTEEQALAAGRATETECFNRLSASTPIQPGYREVYMRNTQSKCIEEANAAAERVRSAAAERQQAERDRERARLAEAERQAALERAERDRQEAVEAEKARERLRGQAAAEKEDQLSSKLKELGYTLVSPVDLELDWRDLRAGSRKIAMKGIYREVDDVEALSVLNKDDPLIRIYSDDASRDARKTFLECRNSDFSLSKCRMIVGATVATCTRNKGQLNEKEVPCLRVREVFLLPNESDMTTGDKRR